MAKDLRGFLKELEAEEPDQILRVKREVDPHFEVTGVLAKLGEGAQVSRRHLRESQRFHVTRRNQCPRRCSAPVSSHRAQECYVGGIYP